MILIGSSFVPSSIFFTSEQDTRVILVTAASRVRNNFFINSTPLLQIEMFRFYFPVVFDCSFVQMDDQTIQYEMHGLVKLIAERLDCRDVIVFGAGIDGQHRIERFTEFFVV